MTTYLKVQEQLTYLKFKSAQHYLEQLFHDRQLTEAELSGLYKVLAKEVEDKEENNRLYNVKVAAFPYLKTIDDYYFSFQPNIDEDQIKAIIDASFYEEAKNVVLVGNPGTGKTHLAISIAYSVAIKRNSVYFIKFNKLIQSLRTAYQEGALERKIKVLFKYKLLVIDEVGFYEISPLEAKLFFQLIDLRYTKRSTVFTSNLTFDKWHIIMGQDEMLTKAIVDRILHHAYLFNITGPSYRIKDKIEAGQKVPKIKTASFTIQGKIRGFIMFILKMKAPPWYNKLTTKKHEEELPCINIITHLIMLWY